MSRLADAILSGAYAGSSPTLDLQKGGQDGFAPNLTEWVSHQAYVSRNVVCLLIEAPKGFQYLPNPQFWVGALKAMVETHAKSITGFNAGLKADFAENAVSGGGEMHEDLTNITRDRTNLTMNFVDKYGRPIQNFLYEWMTNLGMDPDSKVANIATLAGNKPTDLLADISTATMLFFEPDPTHSTIQKAWLGTNMFPKGTGDIVAKRDLTAAGDISELAIEFTGIYQSTLGVRAFAQNLLSKINFVNANPYLRPAFVQAVEADVNAPGLRGYQSQAEELGATSIRK
jgi:hypothetical protein